ncbi:MULTISPECIES: single-stranded-DNA-specific exonuclease RecJ [unclassified Ruminococcus]|uniref:single-stranded-DNA-specific exonuclease RecJ n=1 Tax=unclassified Ruminococcus TaxID=2608920 RepID=UPI002109B903|nr:MULTISPECIES: single-stranded-DNA-specific exonuclease RecJ [unclassified Ruminococcus]MCQ4022263.1 single-stranded-DNA-specific exonuclease RecJ [Ruminococcus sp. zg-924]MCQ4114591.1 single-stranded-DNA-specific exonuclease RecJ [Ruminococcus sp. zg-921]
MKIWNVSKLNREAAKSIALNSGIPQLAACVMAARGIEDEQTAAQLLPFDGELFDPFLMKDMERAVQRITAAIENGEKICIYGDYDADGVCASTLLFSNLSDIGADAFYYIPSRLSEGYGMNFEAVDKIAQQGATLIVTVDNGISAIQEIEYAKGLGIDTVVTDHHKVGQKLPNAVAVLNPHRSDCNYPFKDLCGVGVAFKLAAAMVSDTISQEDLLCEYADFITIGTIGDIVPLVGENRLFVRQGLQLIRTMPRPGISALLRAGGIEPEKISSGRVSYSLVPRINACGRLKHSQTAVELLLCEDEDLAYESALELDEDNSNRRKIEHDILNEAIEIIESKPEIKYQSIIVVSKEGWNAGVIGIVASRLREIYGRPAIIIAVSDGVAKGSGRSIAGFSLVDAVFACKDILQHYGGHPMAAGITLAEDKIDTFAKMINGYADTIGEMPYPTLNIDLKLNPSGINCDLVRELEYLEPYGAGNPQPLFGLYNMKIAGITELGGGKHLRLSVCRGEQYLTVMYFSHTRDSFTFSLGDCVDLAVTLDINEYNGYENVSVVVRDIKLSEENPFECLQSIRIYEKMSINSRTMAEKLSGILPSRADFALVYREIKAHGELKTSLARLWCCFGCGKLSCGKLKVILTAMAELQLISCEENGDILTIKALEYNGKADLSSAPVMLKLKKGIDKG